MGLSELFYQKKIDSRLAEKANSAAAMRKLISRTIAAGENVAAITWTQDDAGSDLALEEVEVRTYIPLNDLAVGASGYLFGKINDISTGYFTSDSDNKIVFNFALYRRLMGTNVLSIKKVGSFVDLIDMYQTSDGTTRGIGVSSAFLSVPVSKITKLYLYPLASVIPVGTVIEVYGRTE